MKIILPPDKEIETEQGIVIVGANGSGKTRLGSWIDIISSQKNITHRISAQKSLNMPESIRSMAINKSMSALLCGNENATTEQYGAYKIGHKWHGKPETTLIDDYERLLVYLFSEYNEITSKYFEDSKNSNTKIKQPITKISIIEEIWKEIMPHRELIIGGGSIQTRIKESIQKEYNASEMSDGERVTFYLIGQCLSAPQNSILVIDEPELHLHKSILYALWNKIEKFRSDCLFVYLTHDIDFAVSRIGFKKIWLKSYDGNNNWEWEDIGNEIDLPEELLLEVYGNRKKVLFVEGDNGSYDVKFFRNIFDDFFVKPVGNCENVINYTKTLRKNASFHNLEVFGLIDKDRRTEEEIDSLKDSGIYTLKVAEVENLFATPEILKIICDKLEKKEEYETIFINVKKFVFDELKKELEIQISERVVEEISFLLKRMDISSKSKEELQNNYEKNIAEINIENIYNDVQKNFGDILKEEDYDGLLNFYNRKSISSRIGKEFGLKENELPSFVVRISNSNDKKLINKIKEIIKNYMHKDLADLIIVKDAD